jgi:DNA-binding response OmpR family regulator
MDKKILLAEDDMFINKAYSTGLIDDGFKVVTVSDGAEALEKLKSEKFDLVLLDLIMPVINGFEVLAQMRDDKQLSSIPVLVLSNLGQESDIQKATDLGAIDYLVKSDHTMKDVIERIKQHLASG